MEAKPISIAGFAGMNNVDRISQVPLVLNMDTTPDKRLETRDGYTLFYTLADVHSLATDGLSLFCAGKGTASLESLYKLTPQKVLTELAAIRGKGDPLYYVLFPDKVFISSRSWNGVYDYATVRPWGTPANASPDLTDIYNSEQMLPLNSGPPPYMENLCLAGGRIWGTRGSNVHYNDPPMAYEMYRPDTFLPFTEPLTMIAKTHSGMYFASETTTWFGTGFDPLEMAFTQVGDGALAGSLQYIPNYKNDTDVPIWTGRDGIFVGMQGTVMHITSEQVNFAGSGKVASLFRDKGGVIQYLSNSLLSPGEALATQVFKTGRFSETATKNDGDTAGFGDSVSCEVYRNGQPI